MLHYWLGNLFIVYCFMQCNKVYAPMLLFISVFCIISCLENGRNAVMEKQSVVHKYRSDFPIDHVLAQQWHRWNVDIHLHSGWFRANSHSDFIPTSETEIKPTFKIEPLEGNLFWAAIRQSFLGLCQNQLTFCFGLRL